MSIASLEQVKGMLRGLFGVADGNIAKAQETANAAQQAVASKMDADNPVGTGSFSMGRENGTTVGANSHAVGYRTTASGDYSHAEGYRTTASGNYSHAEGMMTTAPGDYSHAEGYKTTAISPGSHAEGNDTIANGMGSHAEGNGTYAVAGQHAQGRHNIIDNNLRYAHIVGNGGNSNTRSNAHTLDWNGNAWYAGTVEGTALILTSPNGTRYQITVDDTGALTAAAL